MQTTTATDQPTPGHWTYGEYDDRSLYPGQYRIEQTPGGLWIANVRTRADARLMRAAPEMLTEIHATVAQFANIADRLQREDASVAVLSAIRQRVASLDAAMERAERL